jgi:hypothetical protein
MSETLVRLVLAERHEVSGYRDGFFRTAYRLRRQHVLSVEDHKVLDTLLKWFGTNLSVPARFNRSRSKGYDRRNTRGISWFRESADEQISKAHQVAALLRKYGYDVFEVRTERPGFVIYCDKHQIVAEPFSDIAGVK